MFEFGFPKEGKQGFVRIGQIEGIEFVFLATVIDGSRHFVHGRAGETGGRRGIAGTGSKGSSRSDNGSENGSLHGNGGGGGGG